MGNTNLSLSGGGSVVAALASSDGGFKLNLMLIGGAVARVDVRRFLADCSAESSS